MELTHKDGAATLLTTLALLVFAASHEGWNVPLVGSSHRWAAGAILLLGMLGCGLGERSGGATTRLFGAIGIAALVSAAVALATGSLTALSLLTASLVLLWLAATLRHARTRRTVTS